MKRPHKSGWRSAEQRKGRPPEAQPVIPAAFEVMLKQHGIPEAEAHKSPIVQSWARENHGKKFLPEALVELWNLE